MSSKKPVYLSRKGTKYTNRKRTIGKNKRPLNRYEADADLSRVSASAKKLKTTTEVSIDPTTTYCFVSFVSVFAEISEHVVCKTCHSKLQFHQSSKRGLGFKIVIVCESCGDKLTGDKTIASIANSPCANGGYEINRRIVLAMRLIGVGLDGLLKFCGFMDISSPTLKSIYSSILEAVSVAAKSVRDSGTMKETAEKEANSHGNFESVLRSIVPESSSNDEKISDVCKYLAKCVVNGGIASIMRVMSVLGVKVGENCYNYCAEADEERIEASLAEETVDLEAELPLESAEKIKINRK